MSLMTESVEIDNGMYAEMILCYMVKFPTNLGLTLHYEFLNGNSERDGQDGKVGI